MDSNEMPKLGAENIFKLPFTMRSIQWGFCLGTLFACFKYHRVRSVIDATLYGTTWGIGITGLHWFYNMYQFTIVQHALKAQTLRRQHIIQTSRFVPHYIRDRYQVHDLTDEQIERTVNYIDSKWGIIQDDLNK